MITWIEDDPPIIAYKVGCRCKGEAAEEPEKPTEKGKGDANEHSERCNTAFAYHLQYCFFSTTHHFESED